MQPLMDNLEAQTYETFEKDAVKYIQVWQCMHDIFLTKDIYLMSIFSVPLGWVPVNSTSWVILLPFVGHWSSLVIAFLLILHHEMAYSILHPKMLFLVGMIRIVFYLLW